MTKITDIETPEQMAERLLPLTDLGVRCPSGWKCNSDYYRNKEDREKDIEDHYQCEVIGDGRAVRIAVAAALRAERERALVALWDCPACGFSFDARHTDEPDGGYSCPNCKQAELEAELASRDIERAELTALATGLEAERDAYRDALAKITGRTAIDSQSQFPRS